MNENKIEIFQLEDMQFRKRIGMTESFEGFGIVELPNKELVENMDEITHQNKQCIELQ